MLSAPARPGAPDASLSCCCVGSTRRLRWPGDATECCSKTDRALQHAGDTLLKSPLLGAGPPLPSAAGERSGHGGRGRTPLLDVDPSFPWAAWLMSYRNG